MYIERCRIVLVPLAVLAFSTAASAEPPQDVSAQTYERHIARLAADEFLGRKPATPGEEKTLAYLTEAFRELGLRPGNGSSYLQKVPLVEVTANPGALLQFTGRGEPRRLE